MDSHKGFNDSDATTQAPDSPKNSLLVKVNDAKSSNIAANEYSIRTRLKCRQEEMKIYPLRNNTRNQKERSKNIVANGIQSRKRNNRSKCANAISGKTKTLRSHDVKSNCMPRPRDQVSALSNIRYEDIFKAQEFLKWLHDQFYPQHKAREDIGEDPNEVKETKTFELIEENWQLRWEVIRLKWELWCSENDVRERHAVHLNTDEMTKTPQMTVQLDNTWQIFMEGMAVTRCTENKSQNFSCYKLEANVPTTQLAPEVSYQSLPFLLTISHNVLIFFKRKQEDDVPVNTQFDKTRIAFLAEILDSLFSLICKLELGGSQDGWRQGFLQFLESLVSDIILGNYRHHASHTILDHFHHHLICTSHVCKKLKTVIFDTMLQNTTLLLKPQMSPVLLKGYTDIILFLERLPGDIWDVTDEDVLSRLASEVAASFPFLSTLLFLLSLRSKYQPLQNMSLETHQW